ncbi:hypothetical protein KBB96_14545 [Luteolibacter ambystomatis]|uniref:Glycine zipper domain-containing protein n=1 Tax=Luteolibacter ambystomatis TaxID=2824561 RepID=A0A975G677_9BACT|nr:hypothetical protein [Luteolibacter ambystomatis]QUE50082.1 hypothetical protein KBB96_14545 [Luteolibacter ambystomatis]
MSASRRALYGCVLVCGLLASCSTREERAAYAPVTGRVGGAAIGAGIGSISGHAGSGAAIGLLFGGLGGDLYRANESSNRLIDPVGTVKAAPSSIREAGRVRSSMASRQSVLAGRIVQARASGDTNTLLVSRAEASLRADECRMWQRRMKDTGRALDLARQGRLPGAGGDLASLDRNRSFAGGLEYAFSDLAKSYAAMSR